MLSSDTWKEDRVREILTVISFKSIMFGGLMTKAPNDVKWLE